MTERPHVLFLVLDSVRRDRVSAYGHDRSTTPNFDALAAEATLFENAYAPAPWTLPSHWSMFTGRFPSEHGVTNGFTEAGLHRPEAPTIAERLSERGYRTAGFSNNPWVGQLAGLDRGFDNFVEWDLEISRSDDAGIRARDAACSRLHWLLGRASKQPQALLKRRFFTSNLTDRAGRWLSDAAPGAPTFTFLNLMEAHSPYYPPRAAFKRLALSPPSPIESRALNVRLLAYVMGKAGLPPERRERVLEFYDASLRYQDERLGDLVAALRRAGLFEDALVVVCADHGKTLGEYDRDGVPPHYLRDVNANVPLLVKLPGGDGPDRVRAPFELTRLFELLDGQTGYEIPSPGTDAALVEDFLPHAGREPTSVTRWRALADAERKYVRSEDGREFLLRRGGGPIRDRSLYGEYRDRLDDRLDDLALAAETRRVDQADIDGTVEGQLEDLGYLE